MSKGLIAKVSVMVNAPVDRVWNALVDAQMIKKYMFGTTVVSDWKEGSPIAWQGEWQGKRYEDKGVILQLKPKRIIQYTHFSPLSGVADIPENYHTVTVELKEQEAVTVIVLSQDNNANDQEREHSEKNWRMVLDGLATLVEKRVS